MTALEQLAAYGKRLENAIGNALIDDVFPVVRDEMKRQIQTEVYDAYDPTMYERRREQGGLLDDDNIVHELTAPTEITIRNVTGDTDHMGGGVTLNDYGGDAIKAVERGTGYNWEESLIYNLMPYPRPFHKPTEDAVVAEGMAERALLAGLKRQGL